MRFHSLLRVIGSLLIGSTALSGCSGGSKLKVVPIKGKVTYNGQALAGAAVAFNPQEPEGKTAGGMTDAQGEYTLTTMETPSKIADGALPGTYKVTIVKMKKSPDEEFRDRVNAMTPEEIQKLSPEEQRKMGQMAGSTDPNQQSQQAGAAESAIPVKYNTTQESGLTATVKAGQTEPIDFTLTD
jgi:hypothetical protein